MPVEMWRARNPSTDTECVLHESNWAKHSTKRPLILGQDDAARQTVEDPDFVLKDADSVLYKYRKGHGQGENQNLWLVVVETGDVDGTHTVRTAYFASHAPKIPAIYIKRVLIGRVHGH